MARYTDVQNDVVKKYRIKLDEHSKCWERCHAHVKQRRICKWHPRNSIASTFDLLHEIGHIETTTGKMRRVEAEYHATVWAINKAHEYGLEIPDSIIKDYQRYIDDELDRGKRRGGLGYRDNYNLQA